MWCQLNKGGMIEAEQMGAEPVKQCKLLVEPWPEKRKSLRFKIINEKLPNNSLNSGF